MSKPIKKLITDEFATRFEGLTSLAVVNLVGVDAVSTANLRASLREKDIKLTVVKNSLAKQAFKRVGLEGACDLLNGPCAVAYGSDSVVSVVRELLEISKTTKELSVQSAYMEGEVFGTESITALSKFPTRDEAVAQVLQCALSAGANLAGAITGPASQIASILKTIEENEDGGDSETDAA